MYFQQQEFDAAIQHYQKALAGFEELNNSVADALKDPDAVDSAGNIGGMILSRFKVIFDYSRQRIILEPNEHFAESYEFDMSGMTLIKEGNNSKAVKIRRVLEHSPAAEVGLRAGDVIVAIDRRPAAEFSLDALDEMFRQEGREYQLTVTRLGAVFEFKLKLRRLI